MGDGFTWDTKDPAQDIKTSEETWALCVEKIRSADYDLIVFDEIVYVLDYKFLDVEKVWRRSSRSAKLSRICTSS
jgi:cob(I)alamin adenosyltransferase